MELKRKVRKIEIPEGSVMRARFCTILAGLFCLLVASTSLFAHHGYAAYDMTTTVTLKGTVTSFDMANPHSSIAFDVKDASGNSVHWIVETGAPVRGMRAGGFTQDTIKPGDVISISFSPGKDPDKHIGAFKSLVRADGQVFPKPSAEGAAPDNPPAK
jgi:hypothetical protein